MSFTKNGVNTWRHKTAISDFRNFEKLSKCIFYHQNFVFSPYLGKFSNFQKAVTYVLAGILIGMCANSQVEIYRNDVFIAFETSKMATFHDIPMYYGTIRFFVSVRCSIRRKWF